MVGNKIQFKVVHIYYAITVASICFACFRGTTSFFWRIASFPFAILFYVLTYWYLQKRWSLIKSRFNKTIYGYALWFIFLALIILLFSFKLDFNSIITLFFYPYAFLGFFIAILSLTISSKRDIVEIKKMCDFVSLYFGIFILIDVFFFKGPILSNELYLFLIFSFIFGGNKSLIWKTYLILVLMGIMVTDARLDIRTISIRIAMLLIAFGLLRIRKYFNYKLLKTGVLVACIFFLVISVFNFDAVIKITTQNKLLGSLNETDTRSFLFKEFFQDVKGAEIVWGRGFLGEYNSPYFSTWQGGGGDHEHRFGIEVGILHVLLKGGIILLIAYLSLFFTALKAGIFNLFDYKIGIRLSIFLLVQLLILSFENIPSFNTNNMFIWLSVGIIYYMHETKKLKMKNQNN